MRELSQEHVKTFDGVPELKPTNVKTEADKLHAYQRAMSMLPVEIQNAKMNAIHSPKTLKRFLSADAPENLVARFSHRLNEVTDSDLEEKLTLQERQRIAEIELDVQASLQKYLNLVTDQPLADQDLAALIIEIYQGRTKLNVALGLIHENSGCQEAAKDTYRNAIDAGHYEGYRMLTNHFIRDEDLTSAYVIVQEALRKNFNMPAMDLAFHYYITGSDKFCQYILKLVDPQDRRGPHVILMDHAIRTGDFARIGEMATSLRSEEDTDFIIASSLLFDGDIDRAFQAFAEGLKEQSCTSLLKEFQKLLNVDKHKARIYMADHLRYLLSGYGLDNLGNHLVNQGKN